MCHLISFWKMLIIFYILLSFNRLIFHFYSISSLWLNFVLIVYNLIFVKLQYDSLNWMLFNVDCHLVVSFYSQICMINYISNSIIIECFFYLLLQIYFYISWELASIEKDQHKSIFWEISSPNLCSTFSFNIFSDSRCLYPKRILIYGN